MPASLQGLLQWIRDHPAYQALKNAWIEGVELPTQSLLPSTRAPLAATLSEDIQAPFLIITATVEESRNLHEALRLWLPDNERLLIFPEPSVLFYEHAPWTPEAITDRMHVISRLFLYRLQTQTTVSDKTLPATIAPPIVLASARALMQRTLPYRQFRRAARKITVGERTSLNSLARHCSHSGYEAVSVVEAPGQYSQRGGILDIFPAQALEPYRLEFFGDEIDAIRSFAPATQRSTGRAESFWITPVREALPYDSTRALPILKRWLESDLPPEVHAPLEKEALALDAGVPFPALEFYIPYLYQEIGTLLNYLPTNARVILYNTNALTRQWKTLETEARDAHRQSLEDNPFLQDTLQPPHITWEQWERRIEQTHMLALQAGTGEETSLTHTSIGEAFTSEPHFAGRIPEALGRMRQWSGLGDQIVVISRQAARLAELWQEFTPPPVLESLPHPPDNLITFVQGAISGGWQWNGQQRTRHVITDAELFGWRPPEPRRRPRRRATTPEFPFADLEPGDRVVHEDYGVGVFKGLVMRSVDDIEREYILLEYAENDWLYVPIHQADRLSRYVGAEGFSTPLHRLGGAQWTTIKARVQKAADELATELLDLYAARQIVQGHAFSPDSAWQRELEAAFPYVETEDQLRAIQEVKEDMEKTQPMDRLICGDSGYGKTEVALRAAFKAVLDGKQVAMLVPTTILAQQHYYSFRERLAPYPVNVELLSRFRTSAEQGKVLREMAAGSVDIVIGTHRLLQRDVQFKDLGLVIIDEEQRFGVAHKERLKQMRTEVDVLTLTATPIPRTLYMAMTGARDINIIETPPQERLPISTYIGPNDPAVARRAILRELKRNGQVFYVHNRVGSIRGVAARLHTLVPEARIAIAHGQMRERNLANAMERFTTGEVDVLLATTIIESGLDFPNANTLIVERADRFGLAQLYQLRGRVGRGSRRGYAYFFHGHRMTDEAQARLQALQETTSTGGGFSVALRDLEIRGAGELLGRRQHGHVAAVGFTLYTRILTRAVERLKAQRAGKPAPPEAIGAVTIELPLAVGLPKTYIPNAPLRLQLYRRMAELTDDAEIQKLESELRDRFGPLPTITQNLLYQLQLKVLARDAHIPAIAVESGQITLRPPWLRDFAPDKLAQLRRQLKPRARVGRREIWLPLYWEEARWRENLQTVLEGIIAWWEAM